MDILLLAAVCFLAMVSPGPDFLLITKNALLYPRAHALATAFGVVAGCFIHATYCILGLALILTKSVVLFSTIKYAGACYLIYIGLKSVFSRASSVESTTSYGERKPLSVAGAFMQGFLCNLLNPKLALFLLSLFTQFVSVDAAITEKAIVAGVFVAEASLYWPALTLLLQSDGVQSLLQSGKAYVDRACGALLVYLGVRVAAATN